MATPTPLSVATDPASPSMIEWHSLHQVAMARMSDLAAALDAQDWPGVLKACQWTRDVLRPHNEGEERELFPLLEEVGAEELREQLTADHREMWDLEVQLAAAVDHGVVSAPGPFGERARRLLDLVRQHIDTEEHLMLPLLRGRSVYPAVGALDEGYLILEKKLLAPETWSFVVQAPMVARGRKPGQFLMVAPFEKSERIPLTLAGGDARKGWVRFIMQEVGATTRAMGKLHEGDALYAVAGPMGQPTELVEKGTIVLVAGGYGSAAILPAAELLKARGQRVITILGGRSRERVLLSEELKAASDELIVTTDDGSMGRMGIVTHALKDVMEREPIAEVVAVGPVPMMQAVAEATRASGIFTLVSLNALMVDGTGMCGGCRVLLGNQSKFACVDGPEFDASQVNFEVLMQRNTMYRAKECAALKQFEAHKEEELARLRAGIATRERETARLRARVEIQRGSQGEVPHA